MSSFGSGMQALVKHQALDLNSFNHLEDRKSLCTQEVIIPGNFLTSKAVEQMMAADSSLLFLYNYYESHFQDKLNSDTASDSDITVMIEKHETHSTSTPMTALCVELALRA